MMEKKNNYDKVYICGYYDPKFDKIKMFEIYYKLLNENA